jgi:hypothetical protein
MLLDSGKLFESNDETCYISLFRHMIDDTQELPGSKTWFLGNHFLAEFYTVLDMTPYEDDGKDYIQILIGEINKSIDSVDQEVNLDIDAVN